ncbi:MAG: methyltransferase type 11 [Proteobacteria bacterium]|nr:MAG: methyltransferase type 11 [Pseudomonadota bacterium]
MPESVVFDRAAGCYDATRGFPPGVAERVAALLAEAGALAARADVLEIGVGTGRIALPLAAHVRRVVGVDLSAPMLAQLLGKRGGARVHPLRADAAALPFASARFDAAVGVHVLHLIPRWREALAEVERVLRPGGVYLHAADDQAAGGSLGFSPHELVRALGYENAGVSHRKFETCPAEAGFTQVGPVHRIRFARRLAPQAMLDRMAERSWSITWKMSDADLARVVERLRAELLARFGALDREVEIDTGFWVRAYRPA